MVPHPGTKEIEIICSGDLLISHGTGAQVSVDDLLSPLKNTKQFRSLNKRLVNCHDQGVTMVASCYSNPSVL